MPDKDIFCNVPWYQGHVFWDGTYGHCCFSNKDTTHGYNVKTHTVKQWIESDSMVDFKKELLGSKKSNRCHGCYLEEDQGHTSKRQNENLKSAIWSTKFDQSFNEAHTRDKFLNLDHSMYREWHIDLGNECNLACKMCNSDASSKIETLYRRWGMPVEYTSKKLWINDPRADQFIEQICTTTKLKRIHIMGGEPLIQPKFKHLLKTLSERRPDISFSFVSNATKFDSSILEYLQKFSSVDVELSIETTDPVNDYIRQGSRTQDVIKVIEQWVEHRSENFNIILRPTPSILSVSRYKSLLDFAYKHRLIVMSVILSDPGYLRISLLPKQYRLSIIKELRQWSDNITVDINEQVGNRDATRWQAQLKQECEGIINCLEQEHKPGNEKELITWLQRWDNEYKLNVLDYLPEFADFFREHGYKIPN